MNLKEYNRLKELSQGVTFSSLELDLSKNRTLLYGYKCDRTTCHLYVQEGVVLYSQYNHERFYTYQVGPKDFVNEFIPEKRVYPEACDFDFSKKIIERGLILPFTTFNPHRELPSSGYHGLTDPLNSNFCHESTHTQIFENGEYWCKDCYPPRKTNPETVSAIEKALTTVE